MSGLRMLLLSFTLALQAMGASEMMEREFRIHLGLLDAYEDIAPADPAKPAADPFDTIPAAPASKRPRLPMPSRKVLEQNGIPFPDGASCAFDPLTGMLRVRNTQHGLDLVESFLFETGCCHDVGGITWHLMVLESAETAIRDAEKAASHFPSAHRALEKLRADNLTHVVGEAFVEGPGGSRIEHFSGISHAQVGNPVRDKSGKLEVPLESRRRGLDLAIGATIGPDGITLETDVALTLQTGAESEEASIKTSFTSQAGSTKLVGIARSGNAGRLLAAFLTSSRRTHNCTAYRSLFRPAPREWQSQAPAGMTVILFAPPPGLLELAMRRMPRHRFIEWLEGQGIAAAGAAVEEHEGMLKLIHTPEAIERVARLFDRLLDERPKNIIYTLRTLSGPASLMRPLVQKHAQDKDHDALLRELEASNQVKNINFASFPAENGQRCTHEHGLEINGLKQVLIRPPDALEAEMDALRCGSWLEVETVLIGPTARTSLAYDLHTLTPEQRRMPFSAHGAEKAGELPLHDLHHSRTVCGMQFSTGQTRLLSLHPSADGSDTLSATFLRCDLVPQLPLPSSPLPEPVKAPTTNPDEMQTRTFRVPKDFPSEDAATGKKPSAQEALTQFGISFPKGSSVTHMPLPSTIVVCNTAANLDLIETLFDDVCLLPAKNVIVTTHVFEAPALLIRDLHAQTLSKSDHSPELAALETAVKAGKARQLDTARLEARGGTRAEFNSGRERSMLESITVDEQGLTQFKTWKRHDGFRVELEPSVNADGEMLELRIYTESPISAAVERREHLIDPRGKRIDSPLVDLDSTEVVTSMSIPAGATQVLGVWQTKPDQDMLRIVFVTARLETVSLTKE